MSSQQTERFYERRFIVTDVLPFDRDRALSVKRWSTTNERSVTIETLYPFDNPQGFRVSRTINVHQCDDGVKHVLIDEVRDDAPIQSVIDYSTERDWPYVIKHYHTMCVNNIDWVIETDNITEQQVAILLYDDVCYLSQMDMPVWIGDDITLKG